MRRLAILILISCAACTSQAGRTPPADSPVATAPQGAARTPAAGALAQIRALVGTAACTSLEQCNTVAVGARACGGPETYFAWSSATTDGAALQALVERYNADRKAQVAASGEISDCRFRPDPGTVCRAGTCQLGTSGPEAR
ncbi:MAG: hypothetical protein ACJ8LG_16980 [Massilia sp.]